MTNLNNTENIDLTEAEYISDEPSIWSRILYPLGSMLGQIQEYLNEDMGPIDSDDDYYSTSGYCGF